MRAIRPMSFCAVALLAAVAWAQPAMAPEEAAQAVREFEGDPNLALPEPALLDLLPGKVAPQYVFGLGDFSTGRGIEYNVNTATRRVGRAWYEVNESRDKTREEIRQQAMPIEQARAIALGVARGKFPNFDQLGMVLGPFAEGLGDWSYSFHWRQRLPENNAWAGNVCDVSVAADTGKLTSYTESLDVVPPQARRQPQRSAEQALQNALAAVDATESFAVTQDLLYYSPLDQLRWITMFRAGTDYQAQLWEVIEDADTGEIVLIQPFYGAAPPPAVTSRLVVADVPVRTAHGPLFRGGRAFVSADVFRALGARVEKAGGEYVIMVSGRKEVWTKEAVAGRMPAPREGDVKVFLPVMLLKDVFPGIERIEVDAKRKAVNVIITRSPVGAASPAGRATASEPASGATPGQAGRPTYAVDAPSPYDIARERLIRFGLVETDLPGLKESTVPGLRGEAAP